MRQRIKSNMLRSQTGLQLWNIWTPRWKFTVPGKLLERPAKESIGYFELKKHKPWFDEGCSKLLVERKQAKVQWLQDPSEINGDNLKIVRCEASGYFRIKRGNI
jgi:hypothetical protein